MLACVRGGDGDRGVEVVRDRNGQRVDFGVGHQVLPGGVVPGNPPALGELLVRVGRSDGGHFGAFDGAEGVAVEVADELGANEANTQHRAIVRVRARLVDPAVRAALPGTAGRVDCSKHAFRGQ